jgi:hypothetical protein
MASSPHEPWCPGDSVKFYNTSVNNGTTNEKFNQLISVNTCPSCITGGWGLVWWTGTWLSGPSLITSSDTYVVSPSLPRDTDLWVFLQVDSDNVIPSSTSSSSSSRYYDNFTHYPFLLYVDDSETCGD